MSGEAVIEAGVEWEGGFAPIALQEIGPPTLAGHN